MPPSPHRTRTSTLAARRGLRLMHIRLLCSIVRNLGAAPDAVLAAAALPPLADLDVGDRINLAQSVALFEAIDDAVGGDRLVANLAGHLDLSVFGEVALVAGTAPNAGAALKAVTRFAPLYSGLVKLAFHETGAGATLDFESMVPAGRARDLVQGCNVVTIKRLLENCCGVGVAIGAIGLRLPRGGNSWAGTVSGLCIVNDTACMPGTMVLDIPRAILDQPCVAADPVLHSLALHACEAKLRQLPGSGLLGQVLSVLDALGLEQAGIRQVAQQLAMSPRTLMRHLAAAGTSFNELVDVRRRDKALWMLHHTDYCIDRIATELGFCGAKNFSRTFRRWYGETPSRRRKLAAPEEYLAGPEVPQSTAHALPSAPFSSSNSAQ